MCQTMHCSSQPTHGLVNILTRDIVESHSSHSSDQSLCSLIQVAQQLVDHDDKEQGASLLFCRMLVVGLKDLVIQCIRCVILQRSERQLEILDVG
jgi:hypothetical protein